MHCPRCDHANLPGTDHCARCLFDLASIDLPVPQDRVEASLMNDPVSVLTPKVPVTVPEESTLGEAMATMIDSGVGAVLVTDASRRLVGILTERDFLDRAAGTPGFERWRVADLMTRNPETVTATDTLAAAVRKMNDGGYRHLPVVDAADLPVGVVSVRDLLRHVTRLCSRDP